MTQAYLSGAIPIFGNFPEGFNGWGPDMNRNLLLMSYFAQPSVINISQYSPPSTVVAGRMYIVRSGNTFRSIFYFFDENGVRDTAIPANSIVLYELGGWWYIPPKLGMQVYNQSTSSFYKYNGSAWVDVKPPFIGGRWYKRTAQFVATSNTTADTRIQWGRVSFANGVQINSDNILSFTESGYYDIRLQTTCTRGLGAGHSISRIRNATTNNILAEASIYAQGNLSVNEVNTCSWIGLINLSDTIDFRIQSTESPNTLVSSAVRTFCDCKRID